MTSTDDPSEPNNPNDANELSESVDPDGPSTPNAAPGSAGPNQPSLLTRVLQEFADTLRSLTWDQLTAEERATMSAVLVELTWLIEHADPENPPEQLD